MKFQRTPILLTVEMEGPIGETTPMFNLPLAGLKEINLDMSKTTSINSIGIKQWISWTLKIPADCTVKLVNAPFIIAQQASMVVGFMKANMHLESLRLPYICGECDTEHMREAKRGVDYAYRAEGVPSKINVPEQTTCPKCGKNSAEPDFLTEKTFKFLESPVTK